MKRKIDFVFLIFCLCLFLFSCSSGPSYFNFPDDPAFRERFTGTWRSEASNGSYALTIFNADGTFSESSFNRNHSLISTYAGLYKVSANQFMMQVITPRREVLFNYNFLDNDTITISRGRNNFLYRRTD